MRRHVSCAIFKRNLAKQFVWGLCKCIGWKASRQLSRQKRIAYAIGTAECLVFDTCVRRLRVCILCRVGSSITYKTNCGGILLISFPFHWLHSTNLEIRLLTNAKRNHQLAYLATEKSTTYSEKKKFIRRYPCNISSSKTLLCSNCPPAVDWMKKSVGLTLEIEFNRT